MPLFHYHCRLFLMALWAISWPSATALPGWHYVQVLLCFLSPLSLVDSASRCVCLLSGFTQEWSFPELHTESLKIIFIKHTGDFVKSGACPFGLFQCTVNTEHLENIYCIRTLESEVHSTISNFLKGIYLRSLMKLIFTFKMCHYTRVTKCQHCFEFYSIASGKNVLMLHHNLKIFCVCLFVCL